MLALKSQRNFRTDVVIAVIVLGSSVYLRFAAIKMVIFVLTIGFMLFGELQDTVIEFVGDAYFGNKYSILAKMAKDISAGAVMLCAMISVTVGILLFWGKIF